jgi:iron complex transport system ATP-binding protein
VTSPIQAQPAALTLANVRIPLGGVEIVRGVDLQVGAGEWVTVIGPNGAGKSTLLRAVGGLIPFQVTINVKGYPLE